MNDFDGFEVRLLIISAGGRTPERALAELRIAWAMVKDSYREDGESVPQPTDRVLQAA